MSQPNNTWIKILYAPKDSELRDIWFVREGDNVEDGSRRPDCWWCKHTNTWVSFDARSGMDQPASFHKDDQPTHFMWVKGPEE